MQGGYWQSGTNVRNIFDHFALLSGFDPLDPEAWYKMGHLALEKEKVFLSWPKSVSSVPRVV